MCTILLTYSIQMKCPFSKLLRLAPFLPITFSVVVWFICKTEPFVTVCIPSLLTSLLNYLLICSNSYFCNICFCKLGKCVEPGIYTTTVPYRRVLSTQTPQIPLCHSFIDNTLPILWLLTSFACFPLYSFVLFFQNVM